MCNIRPVCSAICLLAVACYASSIPTAPAWPDSIELAGWHAQAVAIALEEFRKHQGMKTNDGKPIYGNLRHYSVHISRSDKSYLPLRYAHDECVSITFAPELSARDVRESVMGGRTEYGIEVSYDISRRTMKIVKTSFAR
jgi:hypothetical protein